MIIIHSVVGADHVGGIWSFCFLWARKTCICTHMYIYIYILREGQRASDRERENIWIIEILYIATNSSNNVVGIIFAGLWTREILAGGRIRKCRGIWSQLHPVDSIGLNLYAQAAVAPVGGLVGIKLL